MFLCVFEDDGTDHLLPLSHTRAVYDLRLGIRTLLQTTRDAFDADGTLLHARPRVAAVMGQEYGLPVNRLPDGLDVLFVNGRYVAEKGPVLKRLQAAAQKGEPARAFVQQDVLVAAWLPSASPSRLDADFVTTATFDDLPAEQIEGARFVSRLWHLLDGLHDALHRDFRHRTRGYNILDHDGADVHDSAVLISPEHVYLARDARVCAGAVLNAEAGPIYVDEHATIFEHAVVRGPAYVGPYSRIKTNAHVSESAFGTWCKVGGEVEGSVIHSYSNKAHPGFLGDSYLGRWCNIGADTNTSNLKNDYGEVSLFDYVEGDYVGTGRQFVGLVMADHAKCGINTMFNTGTVVGVYCNVFGSGFLPRHLPSFAWGNPDRGFTSYRIDKALEVAETVMARRDVQFTDTDRELLEAVFQATEQDRKAAT